MASTFYDLSLGPDGALISTPTANPMPQDPDNFLKRLRGVVDRARLRLPDGAARIRFLSYLLGVGRQGLQEGNLKTSNEELDAIESCGGHAYYYVVSLDANLNLSLSPPPWDRTRCRTM